MPPPKNPFVNFLKVGKHARSYTICMLLTGISIGFLAIQTFVTPTLLLDDTISLANHYLEYQFQHQGEFANPVHFPSYAGALTYFGVLLWWGSGAICLFAARQLISGTKERSYLFFAGCLTIIWAADDLYRIHETLNLFDLQLVYAVALPALIFYYRKWLLTQALLPLMTALLLFAFSFLIDNTDLGGGSIQNLAILEEGTKLLGIVSWALFHTYTASQSVHHQMTNTGPSTNCST